EKALEALNAGARAAEAQAAETRAAEEKVKAAEAKAAEEKAAEEKAAEEKAAEEKAAEASVATAETAPANAGPGAAPAEAMLMSRTDDPSLRTVFKVKYVADGVAYLEGGRAQGLTEGMKLQIEETKLPTRQGASAHAANDPRV